MALKLGGIVLCGGKSRRMGHPKEWLPLGGQPMLVQIVRSLSRLLGPITVVAAPDREVPPIPSKVRLARDLVEGEGPLHGLTVGLDTLTNQVEAVYVASCDTPFISGPFIQRLAALLGQNWACVPRVDGRLHPLAAIYRVGVLGPARMLLLQQHFRMTDLFEIVPTRIVAAEELNDVDPGLGSLQNLNTLDEYHAALKTWEQKRQ